MMMMMMIIQRKRRLKMILVKRKTTYNHVYFNWWFNSYRVKGNKKLSKIKIVYLLFKKKERVLDQKSELTDYVNPKICFQEMLPKNWITLTRHKIKLLEELKNPNYLRRLIKKVIINLKRLVISKVNITVTPLMHLWLLQGTNYNRGERFKS